jgi:hypothetical protein
MCFRSVESYALLLSCPEIIEGSSIRFLCETYQRWILSAEVQIKAVLQSLEIITSYNPKNGNNKGNLTRNFVLAVIICVN